MRCPRGRPGEHGRAVKSDASSAAGPTMRRTSREADRWSRTRRPSAPGDRSGSRPRTDRVPPRRRRRRAAWPAASRSDWTIAGAPPRERCAGRKHAGRAGERLSEEVASIDRRRHVYLNRAGTVPSSRADGTPATRLALRDRADDRVRHHFGGQRADRSSRFGARWPRRRSRARRSCRRRPACGPARSRARSRRAAICATFWACTLVSLALVATTPMVVFSPARGWARRSSAPIRSRIARRRRAPCRRRCARPATTWPVAGSIDVADGVDRDQRGDDEAVGQGDRRRAEPALHRCAPWPHLADRRAGAGADVAFGDRAVGRRAAPPCSRSPRSAGSSGRRRTRGRTGSPPARSAPRRRRPCSRCCAPRASASRPAPRRGRRRCRRTSTIALTFCTVFDGIEEVRLARARARRRATSTPPASRPRRGSPCSRSAARSA